MTVQDMQKKLEELEKDRQSAMALTLRLEGAIAILQQMIAQETNKGQSTVEESE